MDTKRSEETNAQGIHGVTLGPGQACTFPFLKPTLTLI